MLQKVHDDLNVGAFPLNAKRILVLDDDAIVRELAQPLLEGMGYDVILMKDALHGDEFFARLRIDAAIVDLNLPGLGGLDVIRKIRSSPRGKDIPIFVVTSTDDLKEIRLCYEDGDAAFVLNKPIDWPFLLDQLEQKMN